MHDIPKGWRDVSGMPTKTVETKYGPMTIFCDDELVGLALDTYGEYSEGEVNVLRKVLKPGDIAIDVGANIGALTIPMARFIAPFGDTMPDNMVGAQEKLVGCVIAFEASMANARVLTENVKQNNLGNVVCIKQCAASDKAGLLTVDNQSALHAYSRDDLNDSAFRVESMRIDDLNLPKCKLIKIDVDGHELQVLNGAVNTIKRCLPVIFIENEIDEKREELVAWLIDHGYRCYWHKPYMFNIDNHRGEKKNIFGTLVSMMNVCVPAIEGWEVKDLDEVQDLRNDDQMFDREIARYRSYLDRNADDLHSRWMVAHYSNLMQRRNTAAELVEENLRRIPGHVPTLALKAMMRLQDGIYNKETWEGYEIRHLKPNRARQQFGGDRTFPDNIKRWDGSPTDDPILIWSEQGYGDNIMFCRFMKDVLERAPNAILECRSELFELFEYSRIVPPGHLFRLARELPNYKQQLSLASVPWALGVDNDKIKERGKPYLRVDDQLVQNWLGKGNVRIGQTPEGPLQGAKIGLCHKGSATSERPYTRDIPRPMLLELVRQHGPVFPLENAAQFDSFYMTAGALKALDLVITVDTSIAHLGGALGVPTWLLLSYDPDFRWGLKGDSTIWYESVRIFRQPKFRDWQSVIDEVMAALTNG